MIVLRNRDKNRKQKLTERVVAWEARARVIFDPLVTLMKADRTIYALYHHKIFALKLDGYSQSFPRGFGSVT